MLNRIIRLQAVLEIIVNTTGDALGRIARQNTKMRTALYQNRLALDYLLAQEGGVCGKF
ncbi:ENR1 protein, partial [Phaetusa simplex]|nr:ENR1 protein [Phaetusa simplex]